MKRRILIAEDDLDVLNLVANKLLQAGFEVTKTGNGRDALTHVQNMAPDLIILDWMMPEMTGIEVCHSLKATAATTTIPIILLTARSAESDRIKAFELGVDDYVCKPFSPRELVLRAQSILRQKFQPPPSNITLGQIRLDAETHLVAVNGTPVELTAIEFKLLSALIERHGRVQTRDALRQQIWGSETDIDPRTIDTHLRRLRDKLGGAGSQIHTIRGFGYRIADTSA